MSGLPHPFDESPGHEIKPVTHTTEWCEDRVATVRWCGKKYLFEAALVLEAGETKPCPVCGIELQHDRQKKAVVEGGFPKLSPTEPGGQMNVQEALWSLRHAGTVIMFHSQAVVLAPIIEKALRVTAQKMAALLAHELQTGTRGDPKELLAKCVTAGVAAMTEGP